MRKNTTALHEGTPQLKRSRVPKVIALVLALLVSPLLYEGGQIVLSRWVSMSGAHRAPQTPALDAISEWFRTSGSEFKYYSDRLFSNGSWTPSTTVPLAIAWAVLMSFVFLRRTQ